MKSTSWSSSSSVVLLLFLSVYIVDFVCSVDGLIKLPANVTVPAIIALGDSIVDPGNNNYLHTLLKCDFHPYGRDFMGGIPTGRFCNGKVPTDLIAEQLGITQLVPAYLDPTLQPNDLLTGVSFASGGAGYDPLTPKLVSVLSLSDQLRLFKEYIEKLNVNFGVDRTNFILANSIFLLVAGSDDIVNTYFTLRARKEYDLPAYTNLLVNLASSFLEEIYKLGARRIGVFSAPPLGCLPFTRTLAGGIERGCVENYNQAAQLFNSKLSSKLNSLNSQLPNARIVYIDIYNPLLDLIMNPTKFGFEVANKGCCGTGTIEVVVLCNKLSPETCPDASSYVFWDAYHPTERAYGILLSLTVKKVINKFF